MEPPDTSSQSPSGGAAARRNPSASTAGSIVDLGDIAVSVELQDGDAERALSPLVAALPARVGGSEAVLVAGGTGPHPPIRAPDRATPDLAVWHEGRQLWLRHASGMTARVDGTESEIGGGHGDRVYAARRLLPLVLTHLLASRDRFVLHAGALLHGGRAYVALGDTGTGKSTLAMAALTAGWGVLADDLVVARTGDDGPDVLGIPRPIAVPGDAIDAAWPGRAVPGDPRGRHELTVDLLERGWWPVAGSLILGHSDAPAGDVERVPAADAFPHLVGAFLSSSDPDLLRRFFPVAGAISRRGAWVLRHAADPGARVAAAQTLLAAAAASS